MPRRSTMMPVEVVGRALIMKPKKPASSIIIVYDPPRGSMTGKIPPARKPSLNYMINQQKLYRFQLLRYKLPAD